MVCSERELGLSDEHEGILILPADAPVGTPLMDYLGDAVLDISLTPNLSRCFFRHRRCPRGRRSDGQAGGCAGADHAGDRRADRGPDRPGDRRPRAVCALFGGAHQGREDRPIAAVMQRRLILAGMRPINNIVDITNYVMLDWGQPLHAFDYRKLRPRPGTDHPPAIIVRRAQAGERMQTLDGVERRSRTTPCSSPTAAAPIAVAGVMGGLESEIGEGTTDVLLEAATFDFINNRRTAQALRLTSEASIRFGRGIPPRARYRRRGGQRS